MTDVPRSGNMTDERERMKPILIQGRAESNAAIVELVEQIPGAEIIDLQWDQGRNFHPKYRRGAVSTFTRTTENASS